METTLDAAREVRANELREVIAEGVYRGVMKAIAISALTSLAIGALYWLIERALNSPFFTG